MSYFDQYSGAAAGYADQYNIPQPIFFGLIQQESSWNPFAHGDQRQRLWFWTIGTLGLQ
jgi:soluble lytic murein transglycosylase-like protein